MFQKAQGSNSIEQDFNYWKKTMEMSKIYDVLITKPLRTKIVSCKWLPYKKVNIDNNNTNFRLLMAENDPVYGSILSVSEVSGF